MAVVRARVPRIYIYRHTGVRMYVCTYVRIYVCTPKNSKFITSPRHIPPPHAPPFCSPRESENSRDVKGSPSYHVGRCLASERLFLRRRRSRKHARYRSAHASVLILPVARPTGARAPIMFKKKKRSLAFVFFSSTVGFYHAQRARPPQVTLFGIFRNPRPTQHAI